MLRVGLTGELGSGKSTVAQLLAARGAVVFSSDEMGRALMQPGQAVFDAIVARFGPTVVAGDGSLDRRELTRLAFDPEHPRVDELNAIVHPAVLAEQARLIAELARTQPHAIAVVESALIFSARDGVHAWRDRFDAIVLVVAPERVKLARFVARSAQARGLPPEQLTQDERAELEADARARLDRQRLTPQQQGECYLLVNEADLATLESRVDTLWATLLRLEAGA